MQRGNFVVSFVAELPANRGTYTVCKISRHFASVVGWLHACVSVVSFAHLQLGGALVRCQHEHRKKASFVLTARVILVSARRGVTKAYPRFLRPRRGAARSAQTPHAHDMELAARCEPQTLPRRASRVCVRVRSKKKRGPNPNLVFVLNTKRSNR